MSKKETFPKVLLVGRTNVGKSTLFNRLIGKKKSIVLEREGITRDYIQEIITWGGKTFELIDTGGFSFKKGTDALSKKIQEKVTALLDQAAIICFICDVKNGLHPEERRIAKILHKTGKPIFLFLNKADNTKALEENLGDFYALGFKTVIPISAIHGTGIGVMLETIVDNLPSKIPPQEIEPKHKVVIIGKPNVGKSSLMNELLKQERSIISDIPGTTREAISQTLFFYQDLIQLTDTAGIRRQARVRDKLEELMIKSSFAAVRNADTVILMIDASQGKIADQELKLIFYCFEQKKKTLIILNKIDLLDDYKKLLLDQCIKEYKFILDKIPQIWISCTTKKNINKILTELQKIWNRCKQEIDSTQINETIQKELLKRHLYHSGYELKVYKVEVVKADIPTFILYTNYPRWFGPAELSCIENIIRKHYDLKGCPVKLIVKEKIER